MANSRTGADATTASSYFHYREYGAADNHPSREGCLSQKQALQPLSVGALYQRTGTAMVRWMRNLSERLSDCAASACVVHSTEVVPPRAAAFIDVDGGVRGALN